MGKGASDAESKARGCSCYLPVADVCEASTAGHFTVWLHSEDCRDLQCNRNCLSKEGTRKKPAARLADFKDLILVLSILLSSRFCGNFSGRPDDVAAKHIHPVCKGNSDKVLWSVRAWGAVSAALLLLLLFPSLLTSTPAGDNNVGQRSRLDTASQRGLLGLRHKAVSAVLPAPGFSGMLSFQEAPSFRNRVGCPLHNGDAYICDPSSVHIVMTLDGAYLRGSMAAVFSILQHAACPENVVFHFLVTEYDSWFRSLVRSTFPLLKFKIYHFKASLVKDRISSSVRQALEQPLNYARNYMADMLEPCVRRVIYLDSDLVVVDDIFQLWMTKLGSHTVAAPEYCHANFSKYFSSSFWADPVLAGTFQGRKPCYFNTGVMVIDLDKWRRQNCTKKIEQWMQVQKERRIYELGSLPPFLLVFAGSVEPVEHRWNQHGLGGDNVKGSCRPLHPGPVSLLHWSGEGKPWSRLDSRHPCPLDSLWAPFDLYVNSSY
eukprot:c20700_g1_i1 orf=671-2137(+)